ncbi:uncharacterized protein N7459_005512 [Penicillium hispanicum]|uniref:uncharacterized protein n=1 Tax=Penicillium hispanicum TaxID=1080232 RepID=UPI002540262D|nr:uncharacterized protein N7459_005512 [Penicillium hispanicum]KAJ5579527.1 hypothetical protein N7459_005512 [Penicillium hispanicum]
MVQIGKAALQHHGETWVWWSGEWRYKTPTTQAWNREDMGEESLNEAESPSDTPASGLQEEDPKAAEREKK